MRLPIPRGTTDEEVTDTAPQDVKELIWQWGQIAIDLYRHGYDAQQIADHIKKYGDKP